MLRIDGMDSSRTEATRSGHRDDRREDSRRRSETKRLRPVAWSVAILAGMGMVGPINAQDAKPQATPPSDAAPGLGPIGGASKPAVPPAPASTTPAEVSPEEALKAVPDKPVGPSPELAEVLDRLRQVEREVVELKAKQGAVADAPREQKVFAFVESVHLGSVFVGSPTNPRYFAAKVMLVNLTKEAVVLKRDAVKLSFDGQTYPIKNVPDRYQFHSLQIGTQSQQLGKIKLAPETKIPTGGSSAVWLLFPELPPGNHIPDLSLDLGLGEPRLVVDVNATQRDQLGLAVSRIGPRQSLGVVSLSGALNSVSVGTLVDALDDLAARRVARAVIHFADSASLAEQNLSNWLVVNTSTNRQQQGDGQYPPMPLTLKEIHLANVPKDVHGNSIRSSYPGMTERIHGSRDDAVLKALASTYQYVPREEVARTLESATPVEKAACLVGAGGRLGAEQLPLVLKLSRDDEPVVQKSALAALRHYGEQPAIDRLVEEAKRGAEPLGSAAIESLAASRFAAAHEALLAILGNEPPAMKKRIVKVLAEHPRPVWSDAIYEFVKDSREDLHIAALSALVQVGHPKLLDVLSAALADTNAAYRNHAFGLLAARSDQASESLAIEYSLKALEKEQPSPQMLALLNRVKDRRALPLLLARLKDSNQRGPLIQTLALLGDASTATVLVEKYTTLPGHERAEVLRAVQRLDPKKFRELSRDALLSTDSNLVSAAVQGLQEDGGHEALALMIEMLEKSANPYTWSYLSNALGTIGTPEARAALVKARDSGSDDKRQYARNALQNMMQRSPGYAALLQGWQKSRSKEKKWKEALADFGQAVTLDPNLSEAWLARANAYFQLGMYAEGGKDYAKAYELDPFSGEALTGVCIALVVTDGKHEEAVKKVETGREKFGNDSLFLYNVACVYGRSVEVVAKQPAGEARDKLLAEYRKTGIETLGKAVKGGFKDLDWMKQDPDLASLRELPEFGGLEKLKPGGEGAEDKPAAPGEDEDELEVGAPVEE
jgi:tetratricopeptide (TPR) repeat protein